MRDFGIRFKIKDGTIEEYDPLYHNNLSETETHYVLDMVYTYEILKEDVTSYEWFDLCQECGHEIYYDGCRTCYVDGN